MFDHMPTRKMTSTFYHMFRNGFPHTQCVLLRKMVSSSKHHFALFKTITEIDGVDSGLELYNNNLTWSKKSTTTHHPMGQSINTTEHLLNMSLE
jgi:hypothetical protein